MMILPGSGCLMFTVLGADDAEAPPCRAMDIRPIIALELPLFFILTFSILKLFDFQLLTAFIR